MDSEDVIIYTQWNTQYIQNKKEQIMPFAATWGQLENVILTEINQKEKDK